MTRTSAKLGLGFLAAALAVAGALEGQAGFDPGRTLLAQTPCTALRNGKPVIGNADALARVLASSNPCAHDAVALRTQIITRGGRIATAFVGNRGFHNPGEGSFSLFETVTGELGSAGPVADGEFFFGHFVEPVGSRLALNQSPARDNLMVEVVAWDPAKGLFNFYELLGAGDVGRWEYRGDSGDILADTTLLHRPRSPGQPSIGRTLRCSSCHVNGGPILKEVAAPHNDWWSAARPLPLGGRQFDSQTASIAAGFIDGSRLSTSVRTGLTKLNASVKFREAVKRRTLQEQLRPLFCPVELNLESDTTPLDGKSAATRLPSALWIDPRLAQASLGVARADYDAALAETGSRFPEITRSDADHAWLGPVKALSDQIAVSALVNDKTIDDEFVADVLAVDFTNPALSSPRCKLLRLVPVDATADWRDRFREGAHGGERPRRQRSRREPRQRDANRRISSTTGNAVSCGLPSEAPRPRFRTIGLAARAAAACRGHAKRDLGGRRGTDPGARLPGDLSARDEATRSRSAETIRDVRHRRVMRKGQGSK